MLSRRYLIQTLLCILLGFLLIGLGVRIYCPGRYTIQTVTHKSNANIDWKVCLKVDRLTGRTWVLEGDQSENIYFREILNSKPSSSSSQGHVPKVESPPTNANSGYTESNYDAFLDENMERLSGKSFENETNRYLWKSIYRKKMIELAASKQYDSVESLAINAIEGVSGKRSEYNLDEMIDIALKER